MHGICVSLQVVHLSVTNDGVASRYTNHTFTFSGGCLPAPLILWLSAFMLCLLVLIIVFCWLFARRPSRASSDDSEMQKRWLTRVMREVMTLPSLAFCHHVVIMRMR